MSVVQWVYKHLLTTLIFRFDSETVHTFLLKLAGAMARIPLIPKILEFCFKVTSPALETTVAGLKFDNPIGLAAGFDYRAELIRMLPSFGFGFGTAGTLTHRPYEGNQPPRLARLVKSRALLVNKGFKNNGVTATLSSLGTKPIPGIAGISIGRTNTTAHLTQEEAIDDILAGFYDAEISHAPFHYYELNISCPNLLSPIEFYEPAHLDDLLCAVSALNLNRPLFVKMPITLPDDETRALIDVIQRYPIAGIIIGNLQKDRNHPSVNRSEISKVGKGNLSGLPCRDRSNELIALAYRHTGGKISIIGCGGVLSTEDAYKKIRCGASLVQLITGLVLEGPFLPARVCAELPTLFARDGFSNISEAVGADHRMNQLDT